GASLRHSSRSLPPPVASADGRAHFPGRARGGGAAGARSPAGDRQPLLRGRPEPLAHERAHLRGAALSAALSRHRPRLPGRAWPPQERVGGRARRRSGAHPPRLRGRRDGRVARRGRRTARHHAERGADRGGPPDLPGDGRGAGGGRGRVRAPRDDRRPTTDDRTEVGPIPDPWSAVGGPSSEIGFWVGAYDPSRPLVVDPVLVYSTYLGGSGDDQGA